MSIEDVIQKYGQDLINKYYEYINDLYLYHHNQQDQSNEKVYVMGIKEWIRDEKLKEILK